MLQPTTFSHQHYTLLYQHSTTKASYYDKKILSGKNILIDKGSSGERSKVPLRTASIGEGSQAN